MPSKSEYSDNRRRWRVEFQGTVIFELEEKILSKKREGEALEIPGQAEERVVMKVEGRKYFRNQDATENKDYNVLIGFNNKEIN